MLMSSRNKLLLVDLKTTQRPIINAFVGLFLADAITDGSAARSSGHLPRGAAVHLKLARSAVVGGGFPLMIPFLWVKTHRNKTGVIATDTRESQNSQSKAVLERRTDQGTAKMLKGKSYKDISQRVGKN